MLIDRTIRSSGKIRVAYIALLAIWLASTVGDRPHLPLPVRLYVLIGSAVGVVCALRPRARIRALAILTVFFGVPVGGALAVLTMQFSGYRSLVAIENVYLVALTVIGCLVLAWYDGARRDGGNLPTARVR